jgi:hypothetical protein
MTPADRADGQISYSVWKAANSVDPPAIYTAKWADLAEQLRVAPDYSQKNHCPLLKLAVFGNRRNKKANGEPGSYRHDGNVLSVSGIEVDYDGEAITPEEACATLEQQQLRAIIYTSYSHRVDKPRWRALFPLHRPIQPEGRLAFAEAINGMFRGVIASESGVLSQSYFFGKKPNSDYQVFVTFDDPEEGSCLDDLDDWYTWRTPFPRTAAEKTETVDGLFRTSDETAKIAEDALATLLSGEDVHGSANHLVGRWVAKGLSDAEIRQIMATLAGQVAMVRGSERATALVGDELERSISGARQKGYTPPTADLSVLLATLNAQSPRKKARAAAPVADDPVPDHLLQIPGVLGMGAQWLLANSKKPQPVYAVQAMLALGATVLGRRYRTDHDNWPSLFLPVLGLSATGKESIKFGIEQVLTESGLESLIGPGKYTSDSGLLSSLLHQPSHVCISDEFGKILESAADPNNTGTRSMLRMMMEVWGRCDGVLRPVGYATAGMTKEAIESLNARVVYKPAMTFVGLATPESFYDALTRGSLIDGFINRMLIVECKESRKPSVFREKTSVPTLLIAWCKARAPSGFIVQGEFHPLNDPANIEPSNVITIPFSAEALQRIIAFDAWCIEQMNELQADGLAEMYGRTNEISMRLALIVALSCDSKTIELEHLDWAIGYVAYWTREMVQQARVRVSDGAMDAAMKDVERVLKKVGEPGLSMRELRQRSRKMAVLPLRGQVDVLQMLKADHVVDIKQVATKTKPKDVWFYVGVDGVDA